MNPKMFPILSCPVNCPYLIMTYFAAACELGRQLSIPLPTAILTPEVPENAQKKV